MFGFRSQSYVRMLLVEKIEDIARTIARTILNSVLKIFLRHNFVLSKKQILQ